MIVVFLGENVSPHVTNDLNALKAEMNALSYYETSAKDGINVESIFRDITLGILKDFNKI